MGIEAHRFRPYFATPVTNRHDTIFGHPLPAVAPRKQSQSEKASELSESSKLSVPKIGGAEMTTILSDNNSRILTPP